MVTVEQVRAMRFRVVAHMDGARSATKLRQCVDEPRLGTMEVYNRRARVMCRNWIVDDRTYDSLEAAVAALNAGEAEK